MSASADKDAGSTLLLNICLCPLGLCKDQDIQQGQHHPHPSSLLTKLLFPRWANKCICVWRTGILFKDIHTCVGKMMCKNEIESPLPSQKKENSQIGHSSPLQTSCFSFCYCARRALSSIRLSTMVFFEMYHRIAQPWASLIWYSRVVKIGKDRCSNASALATRGANVVKRSRARRRETEERPQLSVKKSTTAQKLHGSKIMKSRTSHASAAAGKHLSLKVGFRSVTITLCISDWLNYNSQVLPALCISSFFPPQQALNSCSQTDEKDCFLAFSLTPLGLHRVHKQLF